MRTICMVLVVLTAVSGCSRLAESRLNPGNWFGGSSDEAEATITEIPPIIPPNKVGTQIVDHRALMSNVETMEIQPSSNGILITVRGRTARDGGYNVELVPEAVDGSTLVLAFKVQYPQNASSGPGQLVTSATAIPLTELTGIRSIRVRSANASLSKRI